MKKLMLSILLLIGLLLTGVNAMHQITEKFKIPTYECKQTHEFVGTEWIPKQSSERYFVSKYENNEIIIADILFTFMRTVDGHDEYENDIGVSLGIPHDEPYTFILVSSAKATTLHCEEATR